MPSTGEIVRTYRELAEIYDRRHEDQMRDRFLVLAADAALTAGRNEEAEHLHALLLKRNPHHLLKPYASLAEGLKSPDVSNYIAALRRSHPYERAENLLATMSGHAAEQGPGAAAEAKEELQIFRVREEDDSKPASARAHVEKSAETAKPFPGVAPPARSPDIYALRPDRPLPGRELLANEEDSGGSVWASWGLFLLVLIVSLLLAAYTFLRPFLPGEWLR
jgi:hypothetical protein